MRRNAPAGRVERLGGTALGTGWRLAYVASGTPTPERLRAAIEARLATITVQMSQWEPRSVLSAFNLAAPGTWMELPSDFATVMGAALDLAAASDGAFDPTLGRTAWLLGYGAGVPGAPPSVAEMDDARRCSGWHKLSFDRDRARLRQPGGLWLDLSGIAKGFAVDAVADLLRDHGIEDALVEIGGELVGRGLKPGGHPWWVDIEDPPGTVLPALRIGLHDLAVATSGDYVRGIHTIDPQTGDRSIARVSSVSVLHDSAMLADGWATALSVAGCARGQVLAEQHGLAARLLTRTGDGVVETMTATLQRMIRGDD